MFALSKSRLLSPVFHYIPKHVPQVRISTTPLLNVHTQLRNASVCRSFSTQSDTPKSKRGWSKWALIPAVLVPSAAYLYFHKYGPSSIVEDLEDTEHLYKSKSAQELAFSLFILKLCSYGWVVEYGPKLLDFAESHYLSVPARWVVKHTFFRNFVPGETIDECKTAVDDLKKNKIGVILDYSIETGSGTKEELDKVADHFIETLHVAARDPSLAFGCLKVSGLTSFALLERISQLVQYYNTHNLAGLPIVLEPEQEKPTKKKLPLAYSRPLPSAPEQASPPPPLSSEEVQELKEFMQRFDKICRISHELNVAMLVDAEQTYYQPAIDLFTLYMCKKYNDKNPIVYNTYQMYLRGSTERLSVDIAQAKQQGYHLGAKLVRGAYMYGERERASKLKYPDPVNETIEDTHTSYHKGVDIALNNLGTVGVVIASHNEDTVVRSMEKVRQMKIDPQDPHVQFAQLYGMADHLTLLLAHNDQRVFKYVPFGPVQFVIPYLIRRMQENRGFIGSTSAKERKLLWKELVRRLVAWPKQLTQGQAQTQTQTQTPTPNLSTNASGKNIAN